MKALVISDLTKFDDILPIARSKNLGIEMQSFVDPTVLDNPLLILEKHRMMLDGFNGVRTLHAPFVGLAPGSMDPLIREIAAKRISQAVFIAIELECNNMVVHSGLPPKTSKAKEYLSRSVDFWLQMLDIAPDSLAIHLENVYDWNPDFQNDLVTRINSERFNCCLDIGHANLFSEVSIVNWIKMLSNKLTYCHLHENFGEMDDHLPLGTGAMAIEQILDTMEECTPSAIWSLECSPEPSLKFLKKYLTKRF